MKRLLRYILPTALGVVGLAAMALPASANNSIGLYVGTCSGTGYSYYYGVPAYGGTSVGSGSNCLRVHTWSWHSYGNWFWDSQQQSGSDIYRQDYSSDASRGYHEVVQGFSSSGIGGTCSLGANSNCSF